MAATGNMARDLSRLGAEARTRGGVVDLIIASVFVNLLALALPLTLLQVYDRIIPSEGIPTLTLLVTGVGAALLLEAVLRMARSYVGGWMGARFEHMAGCAAFHRFLSSGLARFEQSGPGVHLERFNALGPLKEFYGGQVILTLCDLPFAILFLGAIVYLAGWLVLVPVVLIALFLGSAWWVGRSLKNALDRRMQADDRRYSFIIEILSGIHTIKGLAMEEQMMRRYERLQETSADAEYDVAKHNASAIGLGALFSQLTLFLVVGLGAMLVIEGQLTVGGLAACTLLAGRAMQPLQRAVGIYTRFQSIELARDRVDKVFDMPDEKPLGLPDVPDLEGRITFEKVSFSFGMNKDGEELPAVFQAIDLNVEPGETLGVTGANASGKTTLLYLMMGLYVPTQGRVLIDGHDINRFNPASVRKQIAYLPQVGQLFDGTIMENITMFRPEMAAEARDAVRLLGLDDAINHMPRGFDTKVGDGATDRLPRGLVQRIAIARALVDKPRILLFDEANSAMDGAADARLQELLRLLKGRITLVLITPRPSLLKIADRVIEIKDMLISEKPADRGAPPPAQAPSGGEART